MGDITVSISRKIPRANRGITKKVVWSVNLKALGVSGSVVIWRFCIGSGASMGVGSTLVTGSYPHADHGWRFIESVGLANAIAGFPELTV
jgi:hypothetical protein